MDMCMCSDFFCVKFSDCLRATGVPNTYNQSYFVGNLPKLEDGGCEYFIANRINLNTALKPMTKEEIQQRLKRRINDNL